MVTFLGRHITEDIKFGPFLVSVYGLGIQASIKISSFCGVEYNTLIWNIDSEKLLFVQQSLNSIQLESDLRRKVNDNIQSKVKLQSYAGLRHSQGLPSRGQRTKTNSQTCKRFRRKGLKLS